MKLVDCARDTTTTIGSGDIVLSGQPPIGAQSLSAFEIGEPFEYKVSSLAKNEWEVCVGSRVSALAIRCTEVISSSASGAKISFTAGVKEVFATISARRLTELSAPGRDGLDGAPGADGDPADIAALPVVEDASAISLVIVSAAGAGQIPLESAGITLAQLAAAPSIPDNYLLEVANPITGMSFSATVAALKSIFGGTAPPVDSTAPVFPDALTSSNVTQTSFTLGWSAATDANGIARYEYSYDGSTWTTVGTALSANLTGRTAETTYTARVRAIDPSGNISTVRTLAVTTAAASGDTQAPSMSGSISTSNITSSGYTFGWMAGSDNVGVDHYETSVDGGTSWQSVAAGTLSRTVTSRPAGTTDNLRVRAHDAAGNISNVLSASVTTTAAPPQTDYNFTPYNGNGFKSSLAFASLRGSAPNKYAIPGTDANSGYNTANPYWNINNPSPPKAYGGWGTSATTPPPIITATQNSGTVGMNGMAPMTKSAGDAWTINTYLWVAAAGGPWYFWAQAEDADGNLGVAECLNPSGMMIT